MITRPALLRRHQRLAGQRTLVAVAAAGVLFALWIVRPIESHAADAAAPTVSCPSLPTSPPNTPAPAPPVAPPCVATATDAAPSPARASAIGQGVTTTAASTGASSRPHLPSIAASEARGSSATAPAIAFFRPEDTRLVVDAASIPKPAIGAIFTRPVRTPQMLVAAIIGAASTLVLLGSLVYAISGTYEVQRFMAHRRMYA